jgi:serine/threonine-protein kinase RIO1
MKRVNGVVKGVSTRGAVSNEDRATRDGVLDPVTRELVFKLINGGERLLGCWGVG